MVGYSTGLHTSKLVKSRCLIFHFIFLSGKPITEQGKPRIDDFSRKMSGSSRTVRVLLDPNQYKVSMT
jgi:hypothetical protein